MNAFCPNLSNKQIKKEFEELVNAVGEDAAYYFWDKNNGYSLDKAPNGAESKLFSDILKSVGGDRNLAIQIKSKIYTYAFKDQFGDYKSVNEFNLSAIDKTKVDIEEAPKPWRDDPSRVNKTIKIYLKNDHDKGYFELVKDEEFGYFSVHFKTNDGKGHSYTDAIPSTREERAVLYKELINAIPEGAKVSTWGEVSEGGVKALNKVGASMVKIGDRKVKDRKNNELIIPIYQKSDEVSNIFDENGEPTIDTLNNFNDELVQEENIEQETVELFIDFNKSSLFYNSLDEIINKLKNGETVSTSDLLQSMIDNGLFKNRNIELVSVLINHDIPIKMQNMQKDVLASTFTDKNGGVAILLNSKYANSVSNNYLTTTILHEIMHAVTTNAINNRSTREEKLFAEQNDKMFRLMSKLLPAKFYPRAFVSLGYYALQDQYEFAASFLSDENVRQLMFKTAKEHDTSVLGKIKSYINSISKLFVNKTIFESNVEKLNRYNTAFKNYIYNKPLIVRGNINSTSLLNKIYDQIDENAVFVDEQLKEINDLEKSFSIYLRNNYLLQKKKDVDLNKQDTVNYNKIVLNLESRLKAITSSDLPADQKLKEYQSTESLILLLTSETISKYAAVTSILQYIGPKLLEEVKSIKNAYSNHILLNDKELLYLLHDNFGVYYYVLNDLHSSIYDSNGVVQMINEVNKNAKSEEEKITVDDISVLLNDLSMLRDYAQTAINIVEKMMIKSAAKTIVLSGKESGSISANEYAINLLNDVVFENDMSKLASWFSPADSSKNEIVRIMYNKINVIEKKAHSLSILKFVELQKLKEKLKGGVSVLDFYETDENGLTTGYLIRKRNYGLFYKDYDEFIKKLNADISEEFKEELGGTILDETNRSGPDTPAAKKEWQRRRNDWLSKRVERKYKPEYYKAWEEVSTFTKDALLTINNLISAITNKPEILDENGRPMMEKLSNKEYDAYIDLLQLKKLLYSKYDEFGNKKIGVLLDIANELTILNNTLYYIDEINECGGLDEYKKFVLGKESKFNNIKYEELKKKNISVLYDMKNWSKTRNELIEKCGGLEEYKKWITGDDSNKFNYQEFKKWDDRNTRYVFKKDSEGDAIIFKEIMKREKPYYGKEYEDLKLEKNDVLKPYRDPRGEVMADKLPEGLKKRLREIDKKLHEIRKQYRDKLLSEAYAKVFKKYLRYVDTDSFKKLRSEILNREENVGTDFELQNMLMSDYGHLFFDPILLELGFIPDSFYQKLEAKPEYKLKYMEAVPTDTWIEKTQNDKYINENFDDSENTSFIPKMKFTDDNGKVSRRYDNSKKFAIFEEGNKKFSKEARDLYDAVYNTMKESNDLQTNRSYTDSFLLPLIPGSFWKRLKNKSFVGKIKAIWKYIGEFIGYSKAADDDTKYGTNEYQTGSDELSVEYKKIDNKNKRSNKGKRPDGSKLNIIPQYYTRRMKDPSELSSDLLGIITQYYQMSNLYNEKSKIKDTLETLLFALGKLKFNASGLFSKISTSSNEDESKEKENNTVNNSVIYEYASKFLDMNLYSKKKSKTELKYNNHSFDVSKFFGSFSAYTTLRNLGYNAKVAIVGGATAFLSHTINALTGQKYGVKEALLAGNVVLWHYIKNIFGAKYIGNRLSKDKLMCIMENYNIAGQGNEKIKNSNRSRMVNAMLKVANPFSLMTGLDYFVKSNITVSILLSYHYVDGKFITKDDIKGSKFAIDEFERDDWEKEMLRKWKKGPSVYEVMLVKDRQLSVLPKYKEAYSKVENILKSRAEKYTEQADGMATDLQKALITTSFLGSMVLIHRLYLPLMLTERFGDAVYDYDTEQYKGGQFRTLILFMAQFSKSGILAGAASGATLGFIVPILGPAMGAGIGALYGLYGKLRGNKNTKSVIKDMFFDNKDEISFHNSRTRRFHIKLIMLEQLLYQLIVAPLGAAIAKAADDDDDNYLLLAFAYWFRAFEWEINAPYQIRELLSNIKSPSAALGTMDAVENFMNDVGFLDLPIISSIVSLLFPQQNTANTLWDLLQSVKQISTEKYTKTIERKDSPYKGWMLGNRDLIKLTPFKNIIEQAYGSKQKRSYQENQIMRIDKDKERSEFNPYMMTYENYLNNNPTTYSGYSY